MSFRGSRQAERPAPKSGLAFWTLGSLNVLSASIEGLCLVQMVPQIG